MDTLHFKQHFNSDCLYVDLTQKREEEKICQIFTWNSESVNFPGFQFSNFRKCLREIIFTFRVLKPAFAIWKVSSFPGCETLRVNTVHFSK